MIKSMSQGHNEQQQEKNQNRYSTTTNKSNEKTRKTHQAHTRQQYAYNRRQWQQQQQQSQQYSQDLQQNFSQFEKAFKSFIQKGKIDPKHKIYSRFFTQFFTQKKQKDYQQQKQSQPFSIKQLKTIAIQSRLNITKQQSQQGLTKNVLYKKIIICTNCMGNYQHKNTKCKKCAGTGFVGRTIDDIRTCGACHGGGTIKKHGCKDCKGKGTIQIHAEQAVTIPKDAFNNQQIVLKGRGHQHLKKFYFGDLHIKLKINNKSYVKVDGMNTFSNLIISIGQAVLGSKIQYLTLKGNKQYDLPKGTMDDEQIIMKGQGVKKGHQIGDHYIKIKINIPKSLNKKQEEIYKKLRILESLKHNKKQKYTL